MILIDRSKYESIADALASADDLGEMERALVRERAIRKTMAKTGEGREVVAEAIDAMQSMDREAVLELTDGAPTTLSDALARYILILDQNDGADPDVINDLGAILEHPWPAEEERMASHGLNQSLQLRVEHPDETTMSLTIGDNRWEIYRTEIYGEAGEAVAEAVTAAAEAVYRAVLTRVIGDRDHHVQLNSHETTEMLQWLASVPRGGSVWVGSRLTLDSVQGGGILVRTRPYSYQYRVSSAQQDIRRENAEPIDADQVRRALDNS